MNVLHYTVEVAKPGKLPSGKTDFPFEVPLDPNKSAAKMLYETYQGVYVNVSVSRDDIIFAIMVECSPKSFGVDVLQ